MSRSLSAALAVAFALSLAPAAVAAPADNPAAATKKHVVHKKRPLTRHEREYGFLPGYRPPEVVARERWEHYDRLYGPRYYGPAWPRFYRGRWNGGGFGPCYVRTPIGYMWNCGQ